MRQSGVRKNTRDRVGSSCCLKNCRALLSVAKTGTRRKPGDLDHAPGSHCREEEIFYSALFSRASPKKSKRISPPRPKRRVASERYRECPQSLFSLSRKRRTSKSKKVAGGSPQLQEAVRGRERETRSISLSELLSRSACLPHEEAALHKEHPFEAIPTCSATE